MEDNLRLEKLENLLIEAEKAEIFNDDNFRILDRVMRQYWLIVKELNTTSPGIFNNIATNGVIDLINRSNLTEESKTDTEKRNNYKDYRDYLTHSIGITIDYIKNYLPEKSTSSI